MRAGLIGLGMMGRHHARVLRSLDGVDLVAVADPAGDPHAGRRGSMPLRRRRVLISPGCRLLRGGGADRSAPRGGARARRGRRPHPDREATGRTTRTRRRSSSSASSAAGWSARVGHIERYNPALRALRARLDEGELGDVYQVVTRRQGPFPSRIADVGVVKDLATHDIDSPRWVTESAYRACRRAPRTAAAAARGPGRPSPKLGDGTVVNHLVNWLSPFKERRHHRDR